MPAADTSESLPPPPVSVFLSYASEDRPAARSIKDFLSTFGLDVWYDENELDGGDAWDRKIRQQIRECDYFMPMISANTQARLEGYFRREWRLAVERTLDMADDHPFLLPVVIDSTDQSEARVPEKFLAVQWLRVKAGEPTQALQALGRRIASGKMPAPPPTRATDKLRNTRTQRRLDIVPEFPQQEPGRRLRFGIGVLRWAIRSARIYLLKLPRWIRIIMYIWVCVVLVKTCTTSHEPRTTKLSSEAADKLKVISDQYQGSSNPADIAKLGKQFAQEFADAVDDDTKQSQVLAIPFSAPAGDSAADKLADSTFAQVYGRVAIAHHGEVQLSKEPLPSLDVKPALERGRANHSTYVLWGAVETSGSLQVLTIKLASVGDGAVEWSSSYPATAADPAKIADDVNSQLSALRDN